MKPRAIPLTLALAGSLALAACGASNERGIGSTGKSASGGSEQLSGTLDGAGSSAQQAAMTGWAAGYNVQQPAVTVDYDPVGSGGGRDQFVAGGVDFAGSDAALADEQLQGALQRCGNDGVFELPNYISAIAVVYNLPGVEDLQLSPDTIAEIFSGAITTWNDPAIAADNPGAQLPGTAITPVHRGDDSGTTTNFTDYLNKAAPSVWTNPAAGTWPLQGGEAANGTSGMIQAVGAGEGAIGYADESQAGDLGVAEVRVGSDFVAPSPEAAVAVVESSQVQPGRGPYDLALTINRTPDPADQYPIVLVSYHIGCVRYPDAATAELVGSFMGYVISAEGQEVAAQQAGSAPISDTLRQQAQPAVDAITGG
ncbi:phosphate ABC transporter substrate-binding protein PstS [Geodermatophilus sp. TF02-6]|uniref:phosphate ABC transporter substrate-binding protein PstS n=1 Tax=Geodermatophilus sp. TF02-6 TaxID=2250575 RepID=UPI000DE8AAFF|nr:phosphate ABC transporter substrate-binding protein PstS [Geodermatophilus sp. TF02-6]RBY78173.1 phosphate ABC transporter substrate-binding protein PstS [Geodermatophilus sp. TF02-6]